MKSAKSDWVVVSTVQGEPVASIIKSHLESEGIPAFLQRESAGIIYGLTIDGLGQVSIMVPREFAEEAKRIIEPQDIDFTEE